ncbi:hypothetical protein SAMN05216577_1162 [Pseudomonas citronellolis]|uniref:Uncharacterized protein n=1 Tax=Pseudomonas citronellolis TaxID=53408 RepID=A0AAQ1HVL0_9PSED|nr:hypothetical protein [Pseudomonas citronellolis]TGC32394.1 hypothetical protein CW310_01865 [Pseudomonas citronellolis]SFD07137.1 hypothetical protein SAMN05216577_1162 [Pseudomonas citronellolis]
MSEKPKLSRPQETVLKALQNGASVSYSEIAAAGGNGRTASSLVSKGLLIERSTNSGRTWRISAAGRKAIGQVKADGLGA